ncbi:acetate CoA-transferase [Hoeflea sp. BAL378]|uniref:CoA transferase subunit A n=1 Tax=Hoeflea sp. BAL378 TaxID=1547437 RepID=UPI00051367E0|nr:CoA transferase subunit A [Hoeflea sp. BAL378]KGF68481.1 acetate CoA-transferase [Hoeflea sp. BAL378]
MPLLDKSTDLAEAIGRIGDGARIMIGGFGVPGTPFTLIAELVRHGPKNLTIIKNDANEPGMGVDWLLGAGMVSRLITSHVGLNGNAVRMMNAGEIEVEFVAQGILAERIRTAGAGLKGFVSDIGIGTLLAEGKQRVEMDGATYLIEPALEADFALVHAARADTFGNLAYAATARNFNPLMAMAANCTIAEAEVIVGTGGIDPDMVHTPAPFVDHLVALPEKLMEVYGVVHR